VEIRTKYLLSQWYWIWGKKLSKPSFMGYRWYYSDIYKRKMQNIIQKCGGIFWRRRLWKVERKYQLLHCKAA